MTRWRPADKRRIAQSFNCLASLVLAVLLGCATIERTDWREKDCGTLLESIPEIRDELSWVRAAVCTQTGNCLITVDDDPEWNAVDIRIRAVKAGAVECYSCEGDHPRLLYRVSGPGFVTVFENLYAQAAVGYSYRSKTYPSGSNPGSSYVLTTGDRIAVTADRGGYSDTDVAVSEALRWRGEMTGGSRPADWDLARLYFSDDVLPSFATYVRLGVECFDQLCTCSYLAEHGKDESPGHDLAPRSPR